MGATIRGNGQLIGVVDVTHYSITPIKLEDGIELGDILAFHRRNERDQRERLGIVESVTTDSFGDRWMAIAYHDRQFGTLRYSFTEHDYSQNLDDGTPIITRIEARLSAKAVA